jgi:hypothetical protein
MPPPWIHLVIVGSKEGFAGVKLAAKTQDAMPEAASIRGEKGLILGVSSLLTNIAHVTDN